MCLCLPGDYWQYLTVMIVVVVVVIVVVMNMMVAQYQIPSFLKMIKFSSTLNSYFPN